MKPSARATPRIATEPEPAPDERRDSFTMSIEVRHHLGVAEQWRLTLTRKGQAIVETEWKSRDLFLAELAVHSDRWKEFVLAGIGRPVL